MEYRKHTSLKDLAQALGVSIPTVSRALKDSPEISRELCTKAKELAKEMNYRPNPFANMNMTTAQKIKRLLYIIAKSVPFKPNFTKLAALLDLNRNTVSDLMCYLEKAGMISQLRADTEGIRLLGKVDKVYLNNTNLAYALSDNTPDIGNIRETMFFTTMKAFYPIVSSSVSDFLIGDYTFEIGGKNKTQKQVRDVENAYVVKDDIEYGMRNIIPLWMFGFVY